MALCAAASTTAIVYLLLCASMAYRGLGSFFTHTIDLEFDLGLRLTLSALSLAGIGWDQPDSWVKSSGVQMPDYTDARAYSKRLSNLVRYGSPQINWREGRYRVLSNPEQGPSRRSREEPKPGADLGFAISGSCSVTIFSSSFSPLRNHSRRKINRRYIVLHQPAISKWKVITPILCVL